MYEVVTLQRLPVNLNAFELYGSEYYYHVIVFIRPVMKWFVVIIFTIENHLCDWLIEKRWCRRTSRQYWTRRFSMFDGEKVYKVSNVDCISRVIDSYANFGSNEISFSWWDLWAVSILMDFDEQFPSQVRRSCTFSKIIQPELWITQICVL